jgi:hypothetical protein
MDGVACTVSVEMHRRFLTASFGPRAGGGQIHRHHLVSVRSWHEVRIAALVNSLPLSLTYSSDKTAGDASSRATCLPDSDVSRIRHRLKSSTTVLPLQQRHRRSCAIARLRPPRRRTCSRSSAYSRCSFLWFMRIPSRSNPNSASAADNRTHDARPLVPSAAFASRRYPHGDADSAPRRPRPPRAADRVKLFR